LKNAMNRSNVLRVVARATGILGAAEQRVGDHEQHFVRVAQIRPDGVHPAAAVQQLRHRRRGRCADPLGASVRRAENAIRDVRPGP